MLQYMNCCSLWVSRMFGSMLFFVCVIKSTLLKKPVGGGSLQICLHGITIETKQWQNEPFWTIVSKTGLKLKISFSTLGWHLLAMMVVAQSNEAQQMGHTFLLLMSWEFLKWTGNPTVFYTFILCLKTICLINSICGIIKINIWKWFVNDPKYKWNKWNSPEGWPSP